MFKTFPICESLLCYLYCTLRQFLLATTVFARPSRFILHLLHTFHPPAATGVWRAPCASENLLLRFFTDVGRDGVHGLSKLTIPLNRGTRDAILFGETFGGFCRVLILRFLLILIRSGSAL